MSEENLLKKDENSSNPSSNFDGSAEQGFKKNSNGNLLKGMVAAIAIAAFLGGYSLGGFDNSDTVTKEDLEEILLNMQQEENKPVPQADNANAPVFISLDDDPVKGDPDAPITIVEFSDFQCPFCSRFYQQTLPLIEENFIQTGKAKLVYRDMPLSIHANAVPAHIAAECADEQNAFWDYHDILFDRQAEWQRLGSTALAEKLNAYASELNLKPSFESCLSSSQFESEIAADFSDARKYGASGTPTFFVGNDDIGYVKLVGAQPYSAFESVINSQLN